MGIWLRGDMGAALYRSKQMAKQVAIGITPPFLAVLIKRFQCRVNWFNESVYSDEYIKWLCRILGGWLTPNHANLKAIDYGIRHMPAGGAVVEVGSFLGMSTNIIAYLVMKHRRDNPFFAADPWAFEGTENPIGGYFDASSEAYRQYAKKIFLMNTELFSGKMKPFAMEHYSKHFFELWRERSTTNDVFGRSVTLGGPISFAYIDGAHSYEAAKGDFLSVDEHLLPGGFILFDDSADNLLFHGVTRVAHEVKEDRHYELVLNIPNYFFRKKRAEGPL